MALEAAAGQERGYVALELDTIASHGAADGEHDREHGKKPSGIHGQEVVDVFSHGVRARRGASPVDAIDARDRNPVGKLARIGG